MSEKPQPDVSESGAGSNTTLSATAVLLVISGVVLLVAAMVSNQWLEARSGYDADVPLGAGLFTEAASSAARFVALACFGATAVLAMLGLRLRSLLPLALGFALVAAASASWWILDERAWQVGRAYPFAMFSLLVLIVGLTHVTIARSSAGASSAGTFVDGQKHGRWYVYDDQGQCTSMEEWERGTLVSVKSQRRS